VSSGAPGSRDPLTLHVIPHTHWDREWYLPFQLMRVKLVHLCDRLLELLRDPEFPAFTLDGQTVVLEDYLEIRPERRAELERLIESGRILIGPWTVLPDEFLVSPEALIRNLLRGAEVAGRFGRRMDVGYVPDPFGHIGQLPQILRGFGIDGAVFRRGLGDEPCELFWESPDGSRVLVSYLRNGYDNAAHMPAEPVGYASVAARKRDSLARHSRASHLLFMAGTDHMEPPEGLGRLLAAVDLGADRVVPSTLPRYFEALRKEIALRGVELPVVRGELRDPRRHHLLPGVLSSRAWIKQRNDACERLLERWAEPFSAFAERVCGGEADRAAGTGHLPTPRVRDAAALLREAWRLLLSCHPHDSICGCSVDQVHEEMRPRFHQVEQIATEVLRQSLQSLADAVDTRELLRSGAESALVVFNATAHARSERLRVRLALPAGATGFEIVDGAGRALPCRELEREERTLATLELEAAQLPGMLSNVDSGQLLDQAILDVDVRSERSRAEVELLVGRNQLPDRAAIERARSELQGLIEVGEVASYRIVIRMATEVLVELFAPELPPLGYRSFGLRPAPRAPRGEQLDHGRTIENEHLRIEAEPDGRVALLDRRSGARFSNLLGLRDVADRGDSYNFCPLEGDRPIEAPEGSAGVRRVETETGSELEIERRVRVPRALAPDRRARSAESTVLVVRTRIRLAPGAARADVELEIESDACDHRLQLLAPLGEPVASADFGAHFDVVPRSTEAPRGETTWAEQPRPEHPVRDFVAARRPSDRAGLCVAARGLREATAEPDGTLAFTLIRAFGWLSRDDLSSRRGGAGPSLETPGGQERGTHRFELALIPFAGALPAALAEVDAHALPPRAVSTRVGTGTLPLASSFLRVSPPEFALTAIKRAERGDGLIVRGVSLAADPIEVALDSAPMLGLRSAQRAHLDETQAGELRATTEGALRFSVHPRQILTLRLA
jgi:alpha-mannosidase